MGDPSNDAENRTVPSAGGYGLLARLVRWIHSDGDEAHCLGRLYIGAMGRPVALLSQVRTNEWGRGIGDREFPNAASAFVKLFPPSLNVPTATIVWIGHYGDFSSWDALFAPEEFEEVTLDWDGRRFNYVDDPRPLPKTVVADLLLDGIEPADPLNVLASLGEATK